MGHNTQSDWAMSEAEAITHRLAWELLNMVQYSLRKRDVDIRNNIYDFILFYYVGTYNLHYIFYCILFCYFMCSSTTINMCIEEISYLAKEHIINISVIYLYNISILYYCF